MKKVYLLLLIACLSITGYAQTTATYTFTRTTGTFASIVGGSGTTTLTDATACTNGTGTSLNSDNGSTTITFPTTPTPFTFNFCGTTYTSCVVSANGVLSLGGSTASATQASTNISSTGFLMPMWADLFGICKNGYWQVSGTAPNRVFTMEWNSWSAGGSTSAASMTFQVKLYEGTNTIQYVYGASSGAVPTNAAIGIANSTSDFQTLISTTSSSCNTGFNTTNTLPATGTVLQWCVPPASYAVTGGGPYCAGGSGVHVGINNSTTGVNYQLFDNGAVVGSAVAGTGSAIDYGFETAAGTYTVIANATSSCSTTQSGTAVVVVNALPTVYSMTGGGPYCLGGTGSTVGIGNSTIGVNYQLYVAGGTAVGTSQVGTGSAISFGLQTTTGTYTVIATNATTGCTSTMSGTSVVSTVALPTLFTVTGGGGYCLGGTGMLVGLSGSVTGNSYQLYQNGIAFGSPIVSTTGAAISFGLETSATGSTTYTVIATNPATGCSVAMSGSAVVTLNTLPPSFTVGGGGSYCLGGVGDTILLNGSTVGVNYQLYNGTTSVGAPIPGTGVSLNFGRQLAAGSYTVVAENATTTCINNMFSSALISITPLPSIYSVTGGGGYCAGTTGIAVGLSSSTSGTTYNLYGSGSLLGAQTGTGSPINFGLETLAGTYTVIATSPIVSGVGGCVSNMSGNTIVSINPLPAVFTVGGGGAYCAGGIGVNDSLQGSATGINYQLFKGTTAIGSPVAGTGSAFSFGPQTLAGSYTVVATNPITTCSSNMTGGAFVTINAVPTSYALTGGGGYCVGAAGVHVGLSTSNTGINYQLYNNTGSGATAVGTTTSGTGLVVDFGIETVAGSYTVVATNTVNSCSSPMSGTSVVVINALPTLNVLTSSGSSYCAGGTGITFGLTPSTSGVNYQLYNGTSVAGASVAGTGSAITFGAQTAAGTYTITGTNATTGCSNNMTGSVSVTINPLPTAMSVTGGGTYCTGTAGEHVGVSSSAIGVSYQLYLNGLPQGTGLPGTGLALDYGLETSTGTYTVIATTTTGTGCTNNMSGIAVVSVNAAPGTFTISGGGPYCATGAGVHVGLLGSAAGYNYQLYKGITPMGAPVPGTGVALDFGLETATGTYTIVATNTSTGCSATMTGSTVVTINALPALHSMTGGGGYCPGSTGVAIGLNGSNLGTSYQLYNGSTSTGSSVAGIASGGTISFGTTFTIPGTYSVIATNTTTGCTALMTGTEGVSIYPLPLVFNVTGGGNYCAGGTGVSVRTSGSTSGSSINYQLFDGGAPMGLPVPGTGLGINFGLETTSGTYTVIANNSITGCSSTMNSSAVVNIIPLPTAYNVTGGGSYCAGGAGQHIGTDGSDAGVHYQLMNGITPVGPVVIGIGGSGLDFGAQTAAGIYTVVATNTGTTCTNTMTGSATVNIVALPSPYPVSGGGAYCSGAGGLTITTTASDLTANYQLYNGGTPVGLMVPGTGLGLSFGPAVTGGTYNIVATNPTTTCSNNMLNTVNVTVNPLPTTYIVSGGGSYCSGTTGLHVMLSGSNTGISYQLDLGGVSAGIPSIPGTGFALDFGAQTAAGAYTIVATNTVTGCINTMPTSVAVSINPLPVRYSTLSVGSSYCAGGAGIHLSLSSSDAGFNYQLYNGSTTAGIPVAGSGALIDFGFQTAAGSYRIVATNTITGCMDTMTNIANVIVDPLPVVYTVTGGGAYCNGSAGVHIGVSNSASGIEYALFDGGVPTGDTMAGTGIAIDYGAITIAGAYTVMGINNITGCTSNMSGTANVMVNPVPSPHTITSSATSYCAGGTGIDFGINGSTLGIDYQLMNGSVISGAPMAGTGAIMDLGDRTGAGTYTILATNVLTGCSATMTGSIAVSVNPLPTVYSITGGGGYCPGTAGVPVGLSGSNAGVSYQLYDGTTPEGGAILGSSSSSAITFGTQSIEGSYTVVATISATGCSATMSGIEIVTINPLPAVYAVTGGGSYCSGTTGLHVGLSSSATGINYTLTNSSIAPLTITGTGSALDFGLETVAGTYTVTAQNASTTCSDNMSGNAVIVINPSVVPTITISDGGLGDTLCSGNFTTFNTAITHGGSSPSYQWTINGVPAAAGSLYSYIPANGDLVTVTLTSDAVCATPASVSSSMTLTVLPKEVPMVSVTPNPGAIVCEGTSVTFTANPSYGGTGAIYQWFANGTAGVPSTNPTLIITPTNGEPVYVIMTSNYRCPLAPSATSTIINMEVDVPAIPVVTISASPSNYISNGETVNFNATVVNGSASPTYQWKVAGIPVIGAVTSSFSYSSFTNLDSVTCVVTTGGGCAGYVGFNSLTMYVSNVGVKQVNANNSDIQLVPNPNHGTFSVTGSLGTTADEEATIEITNMLGQVVYTTKTMTHSGAINEKVQLSNSLASGTYILNLRTETSSAVFHMVIE